MDNNLHRLIRFFRDMAALGFELHVPQQWGFYFLDEEKGRLLKALQELSGSGYRKKTIRQTEKGLWLLYVIKIDNLTPERLLALNNQFTVLTRHYNLAYYGGWDVRPADSRAGSPYLQQKSHRRAAGIVF